MPLPILPPCGEEKGGGGLPIHRFTDSPIPRFPVSVSFLFPPKPSDQGNEDTPGRDARRKPPALHPPDHELLKRKVPHGDDDPPSLGQLLNERKGTAGAAAVTMIPSNGASSGHPCVPSLERTMTFRIPVSSKRPRARAASGSIRSIVKTRRARRARTAA